MWAWAIGYKEWDICKLKRCLRDFKTKDHLCLVLDLFSFEFISKMVYRAPPVLGLGYFSLFSSFFTWSNIIISIIF
jgi:hypothetical protein